MANLKATDFNTPKRTDEDLVRRMNRLAVRFSGGKVSGFVKTVVSDDQIDFNDADISDPERPHFEPWKGRVKFAIAPGDNILQSIQYRCGQFRLYVVRKEDQAFWDTAKCSAEPSTGDIGEYFKFVTAVKEELEEFLGKLAVAQILGDDVARHYEAREAAVARLEAITAQSLAKLNEFTVAKAREHDELKLKLEGESEQRRKALEAESASREAALASEREALEVRLKGINDRESRFERRATIRKLIEELNSSSKDFRFELTSSTRNMRWWVFGSVAFMLAVLGGLTATFVRLEWLVATSPTAQTGWLPVLTWIHATGAVIALLATCAYFVKWHNQWASQHADGEMRLKRLYLDVQRANLLIETALEWQIDEKGELPAPLTEALARNLFVDHDTREPDIHPLDSLASVILGSAKLATIKAGDAELSFDRGSMNQLKKAGG